MPVTDPNEEYNNNARKWQIVRDCCEGSQAIKGARERQAKTDVALASEPGTRYLPAPNPDDNSIQNRYRYIAYRDRANFVNFTGHTKEALIGMACKKDPIIDLPLSLEDMRDNCDGGGQSLESCIKRTLDEVLKTARQGILTDYPEMQQGLTKAQRQGVMPFLRFYNAESVINWRTEFKNGRTMLCLVVLKEQVDEYIDEFTAEKKDRYRVLKFNDDGVYTHCLYNQDGELLVDKDGNYEIIPRKADGSTWDEIPFIFCGAVNNDPTPDKSPLYDLAEVNIAHYRNSADYEESCFLVGQPTPVLAGLTRNWVKDVLQDNIHLGSRGAIPLPEGGSATLLQAAPNQMPLEGMREKEKQMIQIGAKIITDSAGNETAEAARIRYAGQNSKLATVVDNITEAYTKALEWALMFAGGDGDIEITMDKEFYQKTVDPQLLMAKIQLLDRGIIAAEDVRDHLRKAGEIDEDRDDQDIEDDLSEVNPLL